MAEQPGTGKKVDKKVRRAAKVKEKEADVSSSPAKASPAMTAGSSPSKVSDKKKRRAAQVQQKEASGESAPVPQQGAAEIHLPANEVQRGPSDKKQLTKAERRAQQEAQRQAKLEKQQPADGKSGKVNIAPAKENPKTPTSAKSVEGPPKAKAAKASSAKASSAKVSAKFFSHLPAHSCSPPSPKGYIHPSIAQIGLQYANGVICGSNARAVALLCALKKFIGDYETPNQKDLARDLHDSLKRHMDFLNSCRPMSVSMDSVNKYLTTIILNSHQTNDAKAKQYFIDELDRFYWERIHSSDKVIVKKAVDKIVENDVIVTYSHSSLILKVLVAAVQKHPSVAVVVVDSRPKFEGKEMLRKLINACPQLTCSYVLINSVSYIMPRATKVLLGAHAVLANGYIMSRVGTSQIALMAKAYNVPLLVCCETYKFSYKMQTDSFVANELGDESQMVNINGSPGPLTDLTSKSNLHVLNLCYDMTPPDYVTGLITETAVIPCTSAPVVIRVKQQYNLVNVKT